MTDERISLIKVVENLCADKAVPFKMIRIASDIMITDIKILTLDHTIMSFIKFMEAHRVRHAPVIDPPLQEGQKPFFVGVVSERDALRQLYPDSTKASQKSQTPKQLRKNLTQIVTRKPVSACPHTSVADVITSMLDNHINMLPILADKELAGIITSTDIIKIYTKLKTDIYKLYPNLKNQPLSVVPPEADSPESRLLFSWLNETVESIMTAQPTCLQLDDTLATAMRLMQEHEFRHIPIIDEQEKLAGIISDRDVLRHLPPPVRRPTAPSNIFRKHLFDVDSTDPSLNLPLSNIMIRKVTHVSPDCTICDVAKKIQWEKISCCPVLDNERKPLGIVTARDLMQKILAAYQ